MNTKKKLWLIASFLMMSGISSAAVISPEEAWRRVKDSSAKVFSFKDAMPRLEHTVSKNDEPTIYILAFPKRTLYLAADDLVTPLLGYSESKYSLDNVSPAFEAWLNTMSEEVEMVREGAIPRVKTETRAEDFSPIPPLCSTKWNQDAPYNNICPKPQGESQRAYTGCVATAMAQVMKYHNWPLYGEGEISYPWNGLTLQQNFEKTEFDWVRMLDEYVDGEYTEEEGIAVARLMRSCGISVEMMYSTAGSGAMSYRIGGALGNYFKYDKSRLRYLMRDYYSLDEWEQMIYESLQNDGPVILDGQSNQGGHSFVCDGYDRDGYFHINWGWGGGSDGYYLLSVLDPFEQGIGGSEDNSGFDFMQDAITGITPARGDNPSDSWIGQLYSVGEFDIDTTVSYLEGSEVGPLCNDGVYNFGPAVLPAGTEVGLLFNNKSTGEKKIDYGAFEEVCRVMYGFGGIILPIPAELPDGEYTVTLVYRGPATDDSEGQREDSEGWLDVLFPTGVNSSYTATVTKGEVKFEESYLDPGSMGLIPVTSDETDIRYYNLQGMEIKAPRKGEPVIQITGKDKKKIIY